LNDSRAWSPRARIVATFCEGEGHNSILVNRMQEILAIAN
jgi:hypothetical protein